MSQAIKRNARTGNSLRGREAPHTVLLRMARDQARAQRVRQLKEEHPELTWGRIAEHIGIKERSVVEWQKTGGMSYANATKFAELVGVSIDWLWRGDEPESDDVTQLDRIEAKVDEVRELLRGADPAS